MGITIVFVALTQAPIDVTNDTTPTFQWNTNRDKSFLVDGNVNTLWSTPARASMQNEFVTFDLGTPVNVGRFRMRSRHSLGTLMPRDFEIQVGNSAGGPFTTVHTINDFVATASPAMWFEFTFAAPMVGFHVRLHINETNAFSDGNFYVQINEVEVLGAFPQPDRANLSWTATCDNASVGTAASFDNRFSTSPITGEPTFQAATPVVGEPTPGPAAQLGRNRTCGINHVLLRR